MAKTQNACDFFLIQIKKKKNVKLAKWLGGSSSACVQDFNFQTTEPVLTVYGEWFIPNITPIANEPKQAETVGFWVGIDGFGNSQVCKQVPPPLFLLLAWSVGMDRWYPLPPIQVIFSP